MRLWYYFSSPEPVEIASFWYGLPRDIPRVDAVYEMDNHQILFFVGPSYYIMFGNSHLIAGPLPLTVRFKGVLYFSTPPSRAPKILKTKYDGLEFSLFLAPVGQILPVFNLT